MLSGFNIERVQDVSGAKEKKYVISSFVIPSVKGGKGVQNNPA